VTLGVLALIGSGEIAPSMTKVHRQLLGRLSDVRAVSMDTPYGFQANVPQMTEKIVDYFATSLGVAIKPLDYPSFQDTTDVERAIFRQEVLGANYLFAGPGSPTYAVKQWAPLTFGDDLRSSLGAGAVVCFASAAALTLGVFTAPIYEIYKVGDRPEWTNGLDVLSMAGIRAAIIPHYDNAEGGNYDTRYCYLGDIRLMALERQLPDDVGILGIDEHTAGVIDLEQRTLQVLGKNNVYWRQNGKTQIFTNGSVTSLDLMQSFEPEPVTATADEKQSELTDIQRLVITATGTGSESVNAIATLARMATTGGQNFIDPSVLVSSLLELRVKAREHRDFTLADEIRDLLVTAGIQVMDGPSESTWTLK
jgi:cyanophycinase-like exopeptidase